MHLINTQQLTKNEILHLFELTKSYKKNPWQTHILKNKTIMTLFFETSTRTRCSFELAAQRLGAVVLNLDLETSSSQKGESLLDTIWTLEAMQIDAFVVRHQEENTCQYIAEHLKTNSKVINAGNGTQTHPTQALLDAFTLHEHNKDFTKLSLAIVGDIRHSRVAHSNINCLQTLGVKDLRLIGPKQFLPETTLGCNQFTDFARGIKDVDVVMMLRIQKERMNTAEIPDLENYCTQYQLTEEKLKLAKPDVLVMHPGPMNRDIEITDAVADGAQSVILQQVQNGVFMRQAILQWLFAKC